MSSKLDQRQTHSNLNEMRESYSPTEEDTNDIVDVMCNIMDDDGPPPMRGMRPAQKTPNSADQFYAEHQDPYESRFKQSRDRIETVHLHNSGYPKMHDELRKKRSTAKATAINNHYGRTQQEAYNICNACMKRKKEEPRQRSSVQKYTRERKLRPRQAKTRTITHKSRHQKPNESPRRIFKLSKLKTHRGCQCTKLLLAKDKESETEHLPFKRGTKNIKITDCCLQCQDKKPECSDMRKDTHPSHTSQSSKDGSYVQNKRDSDNSLSSYNSYASLEHEPMVPN